jgi:hypothetical protein
MLYHNRNDTTHPGMTCTGNVSFSVHDTTGSLWQYVLVVMLTLAERMPANTVHSEVANFPFVITNVLE